MPATLRPATPDDIPTIDAIARHIWPRVFTSVVSLAQIEYMLDWMYDHERLAAEMQDGIHFDMLVDGDTDIGFLAYGPTPCEDVWQLHKIYLLPEMHGHGLGRMMVEHVERVAQQAGGWKLILRTHRFNAAALAFYFSCGYHIEQPICQEIGGGFRMFDYRLAKRINPNKKPPAPHAMPTGTCV